MNQPKSMHQNQIENLVKSSPQERYDFLIRYCAGFECVWGLVVGEDNWVIFKGNDGKEVFPIWPHRDLAEACCFEEHRKLGAKPQSILLNSFINNCVPDMVASNVDFGVFFDVNREGLIVAGDILKADLEEEVDDVWE